LRRFARRRIGAQQAEDIVQDAFLQFLQHAKTQQVEHPRAYLFRTVANLTVDAIRKVRIHSGYDEAIDFFLMSDAHASDADTALESANELRLLFACLAELPPICRRIFLLYHIDDFNQTEVATRCGVATRTVERNLVKAREFLLGRLGRKSTTTASRRAPETNNSNSMSGFPMENRLSFSEGSRRRPTRRSNDRCGDIDRSSKEAIMAINIVKRTTLVVNGRTGADCGTACWG
jgi:RNA polymerase sigma-70 factor (ECF subfamily)